MRFPASPGQRSLLAGVVLLTAVVLLSGCIPLAITAIGAGAMVATDRRTTGTQLDDEVIETKIATDIRERYKGEVHAISTSYNGIVLLTGQVPTAEMKAQIAELARATPKVRAVQDEMTVGPVADLTTRTNDSLITSKVKARFVEASRFQVNHVKVVTERNVVYLMGVVRQSEADDAVNIARTTGGVQRVVKLFEYFKA